MAATIYTGQIEPGGTFTHTNSSGGNERVVINYIYAGNTGNAVAYPITVKFGTSGSGGNGHSGLNETSFSVSQYGAIGKSLAWSHVDGTGAGNGTSGQNAYTGQGEIAAPTEVYLSNGHHFKIEADSNLTSQTQARYQVVVIPE
tara:strand:- start:214 stop:645 length:432 start_codon:yes stop_codon:yes gene_type:complete